MSKVVDMLEESLESLQIPPKPNLSSPPRALTDSSTVMTSMQYDFGHWLSIYQWLSHRAVYGQ